MATLNAHAQHLLDSLMPTLDELASVLDGISPDQAGDPTPCRDFDVAALRQHVVGWLTSFADGFESPTGDCSDASAVEVTGTGAAQVRDAAARIRAALEAGALERPLKIGGQGVPGEIGLGMIVGEYQVHGWDLARATGQPWSPRADGLATSVAFFDGMLTPEMRGAGQSFGDRVEVDDARSPMDRLVGVTGRDPDWQRA